MAAAAPEACIALTLKHRRNLITFLIRVLDPTGRLWRPIRPEVGDSLDDKTLEENTTEETIADM
jgi:hypothetical protein